jgi:hypothetical protein
LGKHAGMYKSEKRKKELKRQKKNAEKRQKRLQKDTPFQDEAEIAVTEEALPPEPQEN